MKRKTKFSGFLIALIYTVLTFTMPIVQACNPEHNAETPSCKPGSPTCPPCGGSSGPGGGGYGSSGCGGSGTGDGPSDGGFGDSDTDGGSSDDGYEGIPLMTASSLSITGGRLKGCDYGGASYGYRVGALSRSGIGGGRSLMTTALSLSITGGNACKGCGGDSVGPDDGFVSPNDPNGPSGGNKCTKGAPKVILEKSGQLHIDDIPFWYDAAKGPILNMQMRYETTARRKIYNEPCGNNWSMMYLDYGFEVSSTTSAKFYYGNGWVSAFQKQNDKWISSLDNGNGYTGTLGKSAAGKKSLDFR